MIITSNSIIFLETQKEVRKLIFFHLKINKTIRGVGEVSGRLFFTANSVDFYVYELT